MRACLVSIVLCATLAQADTPATTKDRLNRQVENFDGEPYRDAPKPTRTSGLFFGASLGYASMAKVEVQNERMSGTVDFPSVFAAELQAGYRILPNVSLGVAPQMLFHLKPDNQKSASELDLFVQATGHVPIKSQWELELFAAPGYSVLFVPDATDAKGLVLRYGGGPMYHVSDHLSLTAQLSHQVGFQKTERGDNSVDMKTSFFSVLAGVRLRR